MKNVIIKLKTKKVMCLAGGILISILGIILYEGYLQVENDAEVIEEQQSSSEDSILEEEKLPEYLVEYESDLHLGEVFNIENYYIHNKREATNYYYIDDEDVLWGCGSNEFGQLGTGVEYTSNNGYVDPWEGEPQKIAEHVVHVDVGGIYFASYLTEEGDLYGMGANLNGLMNMEVSEEFDYFLNPREVLATKPVLLMQDVAYARCGERSIVVLKNDRSVWWWGEFRSTSSKTGNDVISVSYSQPVKMLEDAIYVSSGFGCAGAIKQNGSLWLWGNNTFGSLGIENESKDFINEPTKVLEDVKMVWFDSMEFNTSIDSDVPIYSNNPYECAYPYVTFVEKLDGSLSACGFEVEGKMSKKRTFPLYGDIVRTDQTIGEETLDPVEVTYSDVFAPIKIVEKERNPQLKLSGCEYGWSPDELADYLNDIGIEYREVKGLEEEHEVHYFVSLDYYYHFYFNEEKELNMFAISAYGSRDGKLKIGTDKSKVEKELGNPLMEAINPDNEKSTYSLYKINEIYYRIYYYDNKVNEIRESNTDTDIWPVEGMETISQETTNDNNKIN